MNTIINYINMCFVDVPDKFDDLLTKHILMYRYILATIVTIINAANVTITMNEMKLIIIITYLAGC